jgi:hypothetical protein
MAMNASYLAVGTFGGQVHLWSLVSENVPTDFEKRGVWDFSATSSAVSAVALSKDSRILAIAGLGNDIVIVKLRK